MYIIVVPILYTLRAQRYWRTSYNLSFDFALINLHAGLVYPFKLQNWMWQNMISDIWISVSGWMVNMGIDRKYNGINPDNWRHLSCFPRKRDFLCILSDYSLLYATDGLFRIPT